ncbi:hypothetical protein KI659_18125 [Litoribacter alkaliphilus]|uniref:Uncharacterized protein n=1 Tax=Litoribacter ruber TaxID=702568 RepID=A0AAP2CLJ1_9BACT|nr:hypothetical protein [Litoribacter alkaliphilus]MBS9525944.1 hypothetical protein [Litoribacter alkaliphilus]
MSRTKSTLGLQHLQAERYRQRGEVSVRDGVCSRYFTILVAPQRYLDGKGGFDFTLSYEAIENWFLDQGELGARGKYKAKVLKSAIEKQRRGYVPVPNDMATRFWWSYYGYVQENYPFLNMLRPQETVPSGSSFFTFKPEALNLDKADWIYHKGYGAVGPTIYRIRRTAGRTD